MMHNEYYSTSKIHITKIFTNFNNIHNQKEFENNNMVINNNIFFYNYN